MIIFFCIIYYMINKIRDNLYLAGAKDITNIALAQYDITAILNVADNVPNVLAYSKDIKLIKQGFKDDAKAALKFGQQAIDTLKSLLFDGEKIIVHCKQGKSRSPHVVAMALSDIEDRDYLEVYDEVCNLHPQTLVYSIGQEWLDKRMI